VRVGDDCYADYSVGYIGDRQADAVYRDGTFVDQITVECFRHFDEQFPVIVFEFTERFESGCAIHVALHDVAAEACGEGDGPFEIHSIALFQIAEIAAVQSFRRKIGGETICADIDRCETDAVDGYAGSDGEVIENARAGDGKARAWLFDTP